MSELLRDVISPATFGLREARFATLVLTGVLACLAQPVRSASAARTSALGSARASETDAARSSPLDDLDHGVGQGFRLCRTGLTVGGFASVEGKREEGEAGTMEIDGVNFLVRFEPVDSLRAFSELEIGQLLAIDEAGDVMSDPNLEVSRLYGEIDVDRHLSVRLGKFLTPIGLWNSAPAEPFVWTTSEPLIVDLGFEEHTTGAMVRGSAFPDGREVTYGVHGQFLEPLDPDDPEKGTSRSVGAYLRYSPRPVAWAAGSSFLASERDGYWTYLGGIDAEWNGGPIDVTAELLVSGGDSPEARLWGAYLQGVYEAFSVVNLVTRYEHLDPAGTDPSVNLFDFGVAWIPHYQWLLKADYAVVDRNTDEAFPGLQASVSFLF